LHAKLFIKRKHVSIERLAYAIFFTEYTLYHISKNKYVLSVESYINRITLL